MALESVWMEGDAVAQLARVAGMDDCVFAVGMPDLHSGPGIPIGAALAFGRTIHPHLVGSDAGCGARVVSLGKKLKVRGEALERRTRAAFEAPLDEHLDLDGVDDEALLRAVWERGAEAIAEYARTEDLAAFARAEAEPAWLPASRRFPDGELPEALRLDARGRCFAASLGTIGGGNHFAELGAVESITDPAAAEALGLQRRGHVILAHSGSRGLGRALALRWGPGGLVETEDQATYLAELAGAVRFAIANRVLLCWRMLSACGAAKSSRIRGTFDLVHNFVSDEGEQGWVHRKGCAPAKQGVPLVVLGSRGAPSWIMRGGGQPACLCSVAHGAGRRMTRGEARDKLKQRHTRASVKQNAVGRRVLCDDTKLLYEEHPDAYKAIDPIIETLERAGAATRVAASSPLLTVKLR